MSGKPAGSNHKLALVAVFLALITLVVYGQTLTHDFINFDDDRYVYHNQHVLHGLTRAGVAWALTTNCESNWHPVTWLSHMLDCQMYGVKPWGHHLSALLLHLANTLLLFFVLRRMTGRIWPSAFVAAMFAAHPLHVESVAWVAERKDTLSTFFWMLTIWAYVRYAELPSIKRYLPVMLLFALGLMSKPMLVTLPVTLLLLDYWPLGRFALEGAKVRLILEKIPLIVLTIASCAVTYAVQQKGGSVGSSEIFTPGVRVANAIVAYAHYLILTFWPHGLAIFYLHPGRTLPPHTVAGAMAMLACIFVLVLRYGRNRPYLIVGWLWYFITLIPVIGLVQVGSQAMADRYTYVPLIGVFILVAWGVPDLLSKKGPVPKASRSHRRYKSRRSETAAESTRPNTLVCVLAAIVILACVWSANVQAGYWKNSITLFNHALKFAASNALAHIILGDTYYAKKDYDAAVEQYQEVVRMKPAYIKGHKQLIQALVKANREDEAAVQYEELLKYDPDNADAHCSIGFALVKQGKLDQALRHFEAALRIDPDHKAANVNMAVAFLMMGRFPDAWRQVHMCEQHGITPPAKFLRVLSEKMPDPGY